MSAGHARTFGELLKHYRQMKGLQPGRPGGASRSERTWDQRPGA